MKNLTVLATRAEIHDYLRGLWKSDPFRRSYDNCGFVYEQVQRFAWLPRLFADETNAQLERAHFSTWWNVIMRREYENPIVHDLYYLHEMAHAATMPYVPNLGRTVFDDKMQRNELEASVLSEIQVYFEMPGLRDKSFTHEIYADRFLKDETLQLLWELNQPVAIETLRTMRRNVMLAKPEHQMDLTERWIRRFARQNEAYSISWSDRYNEIECKMAELQIGASTSRTEAIATYAAWIEQEAAKDEVDNIPFRKQAELFTPFYWSTKADYDAEMKAAA